MTESNSQGKLVVISGPSGVGKSTICKQVVQKVDAFLSVSATTRTPSELEEDGREYVFISRNDFQKMIRNKELLEYADVFGNYYGTPKAPVLEAVADGRIAILEIDVQGGIQVKAECPDALMIFILPPHKNDLEKRMKQRGRGEDKETQRRRLEKSGREVAMAWQHYDHMVVNDDLDQAIQEVVEIIQEYVKG